MSCMLISAEKLGCRPLRKWQNVETYDGKVKSSCDKKSVMRICQLTQILKKFSFISGSIHVNVPSRSKSLA